jgi:hypothetical protein
MRPCFVTAARRKQAGLVLTDRAELTTSKVEKAAHAPLG